MRFSKGIIAAIVAVSLAALNSTVPAEAIKNTNTDASSRPIVVEYIPLNLNEEDTSTAQSVLNSTSSSAESPDLKITNSTNSNANTLSAPASSTAKQASTNSKAPAVKPSGNASQISSKAPAPAPAPIPAPPSRPSTSKLILGYGTYYGSTDTTLNSLKSHSSTINELATHTYIIDTNGGIYTQGNVFPTNQLSFADSKGIETLAVVRNEFNGGLAHDVLSNSTTSLALIGNIEKALAAHNYKGVNIDFELLYSQDREVFTNFMKNLYNTLKPKGYIVSIALPAKTSEVEKWVYAYDYAKLGSYSDQVILMTYDEHYPGGAPGPIASINWTQRIVNYAASVIPRQKLLLGVAAYGYDWTVVDGKTTSTASLSIQSAYSTAAANGVEVLWDSTAQVPYYNYTNSKGSHTVYYENSTSLGYKLNIVNNSNLRGIAIWRLGLEDSSYWATISTKLNR